MASKDNRSNRKIDEFFSPTAPGASHVGNNSNAESTAVSNEIEMRDVPRLTLFLHFTYKMMTTEQSTLHQGFRTNLLNFVETTSANLW